MRLADFVLVNKERVIDRWKRLAVERLSLKLDNAQLVNDLPDFIEDVVRALETPASQWSFIENASSHGRQRMQSGIDMGGLTEEMSLVGEAIIDVCMQAGRAFSPDELRLLTRVVGRGAAASINAYVAERDRQLTDQAAQYFSFVAHEIRNPLQNATLATSLLAAERQNGSPAMEQLRRSLDQLRDLVDNSLVRARFYGEPRLDLQLLDAAAVCDGPVVDVTAYAEHKGIDLRLEVQSFALRVDGKLITSALTNLLKNALKFSAAGGKVILRTRASGDHALFEVEDSCGGIDEEVLPRLFQPFVQGASDRTGFGLGLVIVKQAAEAHGGTVRIANRSGTGCCFIIDLPRHH
jgi:signal transduction histidine kinase